MSYRVVRSGTEFGVQSCTELYSSRTELYGVVQSPTELYGVVHVSYRVVRSCT